mgnify:FL=1
MKHAPLSPREIRQAAEGPRVRDIWTGETIAHLSEDWGHYVQREQGSVGDVDTFETEDFVIVTFDGDPVAYIGFASDRDMAMRQCERSKYPEAAE